MTHISGNLDRLCMHTMTNRPWTLREALTHYSSAGIGGITVWRQALESAPLAESTSLLNDFPINVISLSRGGFFPAPNAEGRRIALDDNLRAIDEAQAIGAPLIVLVCGAVPGIPLDEARGQIRDGIEAILPRAAEAGVRLTIEPMHPMFADTRSAINTLRCANDMVEAIANPWLGVSVDVYHLWWDPALEDEIHRAGSSIFSFHVSDWRTPTRDMLNDRALMGEGCIPIQRIRSWVEAAGFSGAIEVEIFSNEYWAMDQRFYLERIIESWLLHC